MENARSDVVLDDEDDDAPATDALLPTPGPYVLLRCDGWRTF